MEPGYELACYLASVDIDALSGYERITVLQAHQRMASHHLAETYRAMTAVADAIVIDDEEDDPLFAVEAAAAEVRAALRLTRRAADTEMALAVDLAQRLPAVWEALLTGDIDLYRAKTIAYGTAHLNIDSAQEVVRTVLPDAGLLTTGQLRAKIRKLAIEVDPDDATRRYEQAVAERRVVAEPTESGTTNLLGIDLPPHEVAAGMKRVNEIARSLRGKGEARTMDQLRADVLLDLIKGTRNAGRTGGGGVDLYADLPSLARMTEAPGELAGYGPVIADIARQVAERQLDTEWRWTILDPDTGRTIGTGTTRRRPTRDQRHQVTGRDPICVFPGCRMPARNCDLDHRTPWAESHATTTDGLSPLCRHDHNKVRHRFGWRYEPLLETDSDEEELTHRIWRGDYQWTSRLGHVYTTSGRSP